MRGGISLDSVQEGPSHTYVRRLDQLDSVALDDTLNTYPVSFSPDGQWLLVIDPTVIPFVLRRIPIAGGVPVTVAERIFLNGVHWGPDDALVIGSADGLWTTRAAGQEPTRLTSVADNETRHMLPIHLPSGRAVLFQVESNQAEPQVAVYDIEAAELTRLLPGRSPKFASSGHIIFWRDGSLWAVPFDPDRLQLTGDPLPVVENVQAPSLSAASYDVGGSVGSLLYVSTDTELRATAGLVWVDREGREERLAVEPRDYLSVRVSPGGRHIATAASGDVFIYDLDSGGLTRSTFDPSLDYWPAWSPNGEHLVFASWRDTMSNLYRRAADGTGEAERLTTSPDGQVPQSFSPDGKFLVFNQQRSSTGLDIAMLSMDGSGTIEMLLEGPTSEAEPKVSPDGRWLAYVSRESGRNEIHVRPFPNVNDGGQRQVSTDGGISPLWGPDSRELFYRTQPGPDGIVTVMMTVNTAEQGFVPGTPQRLFDGIYRGRFPGAITWDIAPDGRRFLMVKDEAASGTTGGQIIVVQNWFEELTRLVPVP